MIHAVSDPSPQQVRETVARVLGEPDYAWWRTPAEPGGLTEAIARALRDFFEWFAVLRAEQPEAYWGLMAALLALAIALLVHAGWMVRAALRASADAETTSAQRERLDYSALAAAFAARGDHLEAARHAQLAVLELLVARRVITLARSEANVVLRERLRNAPLAEDERRECLGLVARLERACFRDRSAPEDLYRAWRGLHERLVRERA